MGRSYPSREPSYSCSSLETKRRDASVSPDDKYPRHADTNLLDVLPVGSVQAPGDHAVESEEQQHPDAKAFAGMLCWLGHPGHERHQIGNRLVKLYRRHGTGLDLFKTSELVHGTASIVRIRFINQPGFPLALQLPQGGWRAIFRAGHVFLSGGPPCSPVSS